jgi:photosystem II stability/assembly factor-like uncharacterized protein
VIAIATGAFLGVPVPRFTLGSSSTAPGLAAKANDDMTYDFLNLQVGWALDSRREVNGSGDFWIFRTDDGAQHWSTQLRGKTSFAGANRLIAFDPRHAFAVISAPLRVFRTNDGGSHWELLRIPGQRVQEVQFVDPRTGWLLDDEDGQSRLLFTEDGGDVWVWVGFPPADATGLAMIDQNIGWMSGLSGPPSHVYISYDRGGSWRLVELPSDSRSAGQAHCLGGVRLLPTDGVLANIDCGAFSSFDLGDTWFSIPTPPPDSTSWARMSFAAQFDWWTMTGGTLWKSTDAGRTWMIFSRQHDGWDYIPHAIDKMHAWALLLHLDDPGSRSGLALTSDGGWHWKQVSAPRP